MTPEALNRILAIKRYFIGLDDQQLPDFGPIPPWTAPVRGNLRFVSNYRRDVQDAIARAFAPTPFCLVPGCEEQPPYTADFEHARGVSALESPQFKLDPVMVDLVEALRPRLLDREMDRKEAGLLKRGEETPRSRPKKSPQHVAGGHPVRARS